MGQRRRAAIRRPVMPLTGCGATRTSYPRACGPGLWQVAHVPNPTAKPTPDILIVHLTGPAFDALARGDLAAANAAAPVPLTAYFAGPDWRRVWQMRSAQVSENPASAAWVTGVIWDQTRSLAVGR